MSKPIQITPIRDNFIGISEKQKRTIETNNEQSQQQPKNTVIDEVADKTKEPINDGVGAANNVLDNVENAQNTAVGNTERLKMFQGPQNERQRAVVAAARHAWNGYKKYAWGHDNLKPITKSSHDWFGLGLTIVDSLDTLYIMAMEEEFDEARNWIETNLKLDADRDINLFEVTIRVLGGLLSAYHLSGDKMFLTKAVSVNKIPLNMETFTNSSFLYLFSSFRLNWAIV